MASKRRRPVEEETPGPAVPTALGGATGDYRDGQEYLPTGFGEIGQYLHNKRKKLQVQNKALLEDGQVYPQIFKGLNVYINGYTETVGLGELTEILVRHGGVYVPYLDRKALVTHIIATNLTPTKRKEFAAYKVATPDWLVDSAREGKLLDWRMFGLLAPDKQGSPKKTGFEEEKDRLGTQTGQKSLFSMMAKSKGKVPTHEVSSPRNKSPPIATTSKSNSETIESLSQRGARLARAVVLEQQQAGSGSIQSFLQPPSRRPTKPVPPPPTTSTTAQSTSAPPLPPSENDSSASILSANLPATTDSPKAPTRVTHSWLPQKERDARTNALVNDPEWRSKHTSASEDFLQSYFAQSRLHHLSSFKEDLKVLVAARQAGKELERRKLTGTAADGRTIFHVDFDCFFVSAGLTTREELRGKPVAVCHARGLGDSLSSTSEIASCSYEARKFDVKNGMSLGRARELCPLIQTMPFEFERYREFSLKFYDILLKHAHLLQAVSMDEGLLEVKVAPTISRDRDPALALAHKIRAEIFEATGCPASIGISHNITLARLATRKAKPASAYHLLPEDVAAFLGPLDVDSLPGIGWSLRKKLADELQVSTVGQLLRVPLRQLEAIGSGNAKKFLAFAKGIDDNEIKVEQVRKSVSAEVNYGIRFEEGRNDQVERFVRELATEVARRLRQEGLKAGSLLLKVMIRHPDAPIDTPKLLGHGWVETQNRQSALQEDSRKPAAIDDPELIAKTAWNLMKSLDAPPHELRGIGITLQKLEKDGQSVDIVREKGQAKLSFAARPVSRPRSSESTPVPPASPPPPLARTSSANAPSVARSSSTVAPSTTSTTPEILVLDDSDSDSTPSVPIKPRIEKKDVVRATSRLRSRPPKPEPYVPQIFTTTKSAQGGPPSASQISEAELAYYGIDVEFYRSIGSELQRETLAQARRYKPRFVPKKNKQTRHSDLPALDPSVLVMSDGPSPTKDKRAEESRRYDELNLPDDIRQILPALGAATQKELLRFIVPGNANNARDGPSTRNIGNVVDLPIRPEPRFAKLVEIDDIEDRLEQWVTTGREGLNEEDIDRFAAFLERCVSRENGHNLSKTVELLQWWRVLLEDEFGKKDEIEADGPARSWWEGYERTVERVDYAVRKETSCRLVL